MSKKEKFKVGDIVRHNGNKNDLSDLDEEYKKVLKNNIGIVKLVYEQREAFSISGQLLKVIDTCFNGYNFSGEEKFYSLASTKDANKQCLKQRFLK